MKYHPLKIGNVELKSNVLVAPLAGYTNLATRLIYREQSPALMYSEMVSSLGLEYNFQKSSKLINTENKDRPLGVQLFGPDAESILNAFLKIKKMDFDLIDVNCGCSVKKILRSNSGAALLRNPDEIYKIVKLLKENSDIPITIKIRSGWDNTNINYPEVFDAAFSAGVDAVTLHPRTKAMLFKGSADWSKIKILKEKSSIPIIGNGDILCGKDALRMIEETGCDGVMLARGLIENPFLIEEVAACLKGEEYKEPPLERKFDVMKRHCSNMAGEFGEKRGVIEFRKFARGYLKGLENAKSVKEKINKTVSLDDVRKIVDQYYNELTAVVL